MKILKIVFFQLFFISNCFSQFDSLSIKWLNLLENNWLDFEKEEFRVEADKLSNVLKRTIIQEDCSQKGLYNYLLCDINYYLKNYDSSIYFGRNAMDSHFNDTLLIYYKLSLNFTQKNEDIIAINYLDSAINSKSFFSNRNKDFYYDRIKLIIKTNNHARIQREFTLFLKEKIKEDSYYFLILNYQLVNNRRQFRKNIKSLESTFDNYIICFYFLVKSDYDRGKINKKTQENLKRMLELDNNGYYEKLLGKR